MAGTSTGTLEEVNIVHDRQGANKTKAPCTYVMGPM